MSVLEDVPGILNVSLLSGSQNSVGNRYIVRTTGGLLNLQTLCLLNLCQILQPLDGTLNQVFLVSSSSTRIRTSFSLSPRDPRRAER